MHEELSIRLHLNLRLRVVHLAQLRPRLLQTHKIHILPYHFPQIMQLMLLTPLNQYPPRLEARVLPQVLIQHYQFQNRRFFYHLVPRNLQFQIQVLFIAYCLLIPQLTGGISAHMS